MELPVQQQLSLMTDILWTADWSKDSTFKRFYCCPTSNNAGLYPDNATADREEGDGKISDRWALPMSLYFCAGSLCAMCHIVAFMPCVSCGLKE